MSDIIKLLPDNVANQIAAGEVVQRPASAVKELLENAIDAGANKIQLILKDAGKALIQVIDNGCGMSPADARMCFERHATSKVRNAEDLFAIRTMGFRGEAMASIAAIAQVEMKTRRHEDELGTQIEIEGSSFLSQEPVAAAEGTSISVKNLFFNTPARRNFLKSNPAEMRHVLDEFQRVSLANPQIAFSLHHDGAEIYRLPSSSLKQRIIHLFGNNYNQRLIPVEEETTIINLKGFIGKPEFAKKTRGEQFFFVNNRFIKDGYLNHAINKAYQELLSEENFPLYVLFIDIDPSKIDVNVHPTKTEIKYLEEKSIYAIIHSAVKRSLGKFNISPTIDFDVETGFSGMISPKAPEDIVPPTISFNPDFNPFKEDRVSESPAEQVKIDLPGQGERENFTPLQKQLMQVHNRYIISQIKSGLMVIDQQAAHERILYERFIVHLEDRKGASQQSLFPQTVTLSPNDYELAKGLLEDIKSLGFEVREFGKNTLVIEGIPVDLGSSNLNETQLFEHLIEGFKNSQQELKLDKRDALARSMARNSAIKGGAVLSQEEMNTLIEQLFACKTPNFIVKNLLIINILFFAATYVFQSKGIELAQYLGAFYFDSVYFKVWQPISYMFMHGGFTHILFNMFALYMFGSILESRWGAKRFINFYLITGLGALALQWAVQAFEVYHITGTAINQSPGLLEHLEKGQFNPAQFTEIQAATLHGIYFSPMVGASGAIFGLLVAFGMLYPNTELYIMFIPVPVKAKYIIPIYIVVELFLGVASFQGDSVAHYAHLGGALLGFILVKLWKDKNTFYDYYD
eukprot:gene3299-3753_t